MLTWTSPSAFWWLAAVPLVWLALRWARTNFNPRQRRLQTIVRSVLLLLVVLALARPVISSGSSTLSVVYAVDISHSVAPRDILQAAAKIDELNAQVKPASSAIVVFGLDAARVADTAALRATAATDPTPDAPRIEVNRLGTDIEAALAFARASLAPGSLPRIVLFSDGRATAGDTNAALTRLRADAVPVSVLPMSPPELGDTWVDAVDLPEHISAGATFAAVVRVGSQWAGAASVELRAFGKVVAQRAVTLAVGQTSVTLDAKLDALGAQTLDAIVTRAGDPVAQNNHLARAIVATGKPRVLYVEGAAGGSSRYLAGALGAAGIDVAVQTPATAKLDRQSLEPFDVAILSDVPRAAIADQTMRGLSDWVETGGGGLLIAGGENVFGEGPQGYRKSELERIAPVTFERRDEPEIALVIVLDKSYSMNGSQMELCKQAAQAAIDALADRQSVGVVTFNDGFSWDVPLENVGKNRDKIRKAVSAIEANGQTLIFPAVDQAFKALRNVKARAKHVVLLSDGRSYPDDYEGLLKKMVEARITVSSIAVGRDADDQLLGNIAKWGHGRSYVVADAHEVPQIFVKEAKEVPDLSFDEKSLDGLLVKHRGFLSDVDLAKAPPLRGLTATVVKDAAVDLVTTKDGDSLLSFWQAGLGRTAVFASDVKDRWATDWVRWRGYGPFFASIVRALERRRTPPLALSVDAGVVRATSAGVNRTVTLAIEAREADGRPRNFLTPSVRVQSGTKAPVDIPARETAPGHYEARAIVDAAEPFAATVAGTADASASALIVPDVDAEYRFRPTDEAALRLVADTTGGKWMPTAASLSDTAGQRRSTRRPLWPALLWTALVLWIGDVVLRRVRLFETGGAAASKG